jgi:hypothetical protein
MATQPPQMMKHSRHCEPAVSARYRTWTMNRHRERSVAIHDFRLHGLLHCVRNDDVLFTFINWRQSTSLCERSGSQI